MIIRWLHLDANLRDSSMQYQEQRWTVNHLCQLRPQVHSRLSHYWHQNQNHNRHQNRKFRNHRHDIDHHLNINLILSGSQYSSVVMASEQVRSSIFNTYDKEKEANASTKSWENYINNRAGGPIIINYIRWTNYNHQFLIRWTNLRCRSRATTATTTMLGSGMGRLRVSKVWCWSCWCW